ncbi:MAG: hypothetical protein DRH33_00685 [Candidatus Nealsonbacteria bacterium]|nr:MAG: hypothetical protein DRH33_00685 [Candidatus Nealsonbacteria bacterium]
MEGTGLIAARYYSNVDGRHGSRSGVLKWEWYWNSEGILVPVGEGSDFFFSGETVSDSSLAHAHSQITRGTERRHSKVPPISQVQNMVKYIVNLGDGKYWVEFPSFTVPLEKGIEKGKINNEFFFRELSASSSPSPLRGGWKARSGIS